MQRKISRRDFLKLSGLALGGLALRPRLTQDVPTEKMLGRVTYPSVSVFDAPRLHAKTVGYRFRDELLGIQKIITPLTGPAYNPTWYQIDEGYVHCAYVQPVYWHTPELLDSVPEGGQLSELCVPYSQPMEYSAADGWLTVENFQLYYSSTHWVTDIVEGPDKQPWYRITDELWEHYHYYIPAAHLRAIPDEELTPIAPDVPPEDKRIVVELKWQMLSAYEGDKMVLRAPVSSGISVQSTNDLPTQTPTGRFNIQLKMPSKHMGAARLTDTLDDRALPGVPWTAFFDPRGYAIHGTYWHNNFGYPMSAGCVNMRNKDAKWLFRWMTPVQAAHEWEKKGFGTRVEVV